MPREIPLSGGLVAMVDDENFALVAPYNWFPQRAYTGTIYAVAHVCGLYPKRPTVRMHRLITSAPDGTPVDHIDHNGLNNTRANLRLATRFQNQHNRLPTRTNPLGLKGVTPLRNTGRYQVRIGVDGKQHYLGVFADPVEAAKAYDDAARRLHGEFAWLNFPSEVPA